MWLDPPIIFIPLVPFSFLPMVFISVVPINEHPITVILEQVPVYIPEWPFSKEQLIILTLLMLINSIPRPLILFFWFILKLIFWKVVPSMDVNLLSAVNPLSQSIVALFPSIIKACGIVIALSTSDLLALCQL